MPIPLPESLARLIAESKSLSLFFDRGFDGYAGPKWEYRRAKAEQKEGKTEFLENFVKLFNESADANELYRHILSRRLLALEPIIAQCHTSTSGLIVGIGRWNPVEVGFTFDRFTGSPFLPGSSVKGLLRAVAVLVGKGELEGDHALWSDEAAVTRIFGKQEQQGAFLFYDALPDRWPTLEVDVMTPHHSKYYDGTSELAADWDEPVPVHFLRVKAGTRFLFWFGPRDPKKVLAGDQEAIARLLTTALDWLGAGAKTSSGYGWFEAPIEPPPPPRLEPLIWEHAVLEWLPQTGSIKIVSSNQKAETKESKILESIPDALAKLKRRRNVTATVHLRRDGNRFVVLQIIPK